MYITPPLHPHVLLTLESSKDQAFLWLYAHIEDRVIERKKYSLLMVKKKSTNVSC